MPTFPATGPAANVGAAAYTTVAALKVRLQIASGVATYDAQLQSAINVASRRIDADCDRRFYATSGVQYFAPDDTITCYLNDDVISVTEIALLSTNSGGTRTYGWVMGASEYDLEPYYGPPYTRVTINPGGRYAFPRVPKGVRITGTFGYCYTGQHPVEITDACLLMAARLFERAKAPLGFVSAGEFGSTNVMGSDPDYRALIQRYRRAAVLSGYGYRSDW